MKALIGRYFKTKNQALKAYREASKWEQERKSIMEFQNCYLIVGNSVIETFSEKPKKKQKVRR